MHEAQLLGVKQEPTLRTAVQRVADDGSAEASGVRGMDTKLMRPAGAR
jgi:hypothetical protein